MAYKVKHGANNTAPAPQNASDIAKQIVGLVGFSVSARGTALMSNVPLSIARFQACVGLRAIFCAYVLNKFFELAQNIPKAPEMENQD